MELMEHQKPAVEQLGNGKILYGSVGAGKTLTVLAYYMKKEAPKDIYVITTAKKRDSLDWEGEAAKFGIGSEDYATVAGCINVDSWNKIGWYEHIENAFFVFDEQRLVGHGAWVKSFLKIAQKNTWVLLSATPGDMWLDYAPVFIANGFYRNITHFKREHVLYEPFSKYPKIKGYLNETKLELLRNEVLVEMPYMPEAKYTVNNINIGYDSRRILNYLDVGYDVEQMREVYKKRWHPTEDRPIKDAAELWRLMRRVVNSDPSRFNTILALWKVHPRLIVFYNFDYELDTLRQLGTYGDVFEWNGHVKNPVPTGDNWIYLVQYIAGAEAWNCTSTDAMILYSLTYSYKNFIQCQGRIDRLDTKYERLYYYILVSNSIVDKAIRGSLGEKKSFNEKKYLKYLKNNDGFEENFDDDVEVCMT